MKTDQCLYWTITTVVMTFQVSALTSPSPVTSSSPSTSSADTMTPVTSESVIGTTVAHRASQTLDSISRALKTTANNDHNSILPTSTESFVSGLTTLEETLSLDMLASIPSAAASESMSVTMSGVVSVSAVKMFGVLETSASGIVGMGTAEMSEALATSVSGTADISTETNETSVTTERTQSNPFSIISTTSPYMPTVLPHVSASVLPTTVMYLPPSMSWLPPTSDTTMMTTASVTRTTRPKPTTTMDPKAVVKCRGSFPPHVPNASFEILATAPNGVSVLLYTCYPGYEQTSGSGFVRCGAAVGWQPNDGTRITPILQCQAVVFDTTPRPPPAVPDWLVPMVTVAAVLLALLVLCTLLLLLSVKCALCPTRVYPWNAHHSAPNQDPIPAKKGEGHRGWPWKRPPLRPQGHTGADGVAMLMNDDYKIFVVRRNQ